MTAGRHLSCPACRIRVRADSPAIDLLENRCPLCGDALCTAASASDVVGFRCFDLDALSAPESDDRPRSPLASAQPPG